MATAPGFQAIAMTQLAGQIAQTPANTAASQNTSPITAQGTNTGAAIPVSQSSGTLNAAQQGTANPSASTSLPQSGSVSSTTAATHQAPRSYWKSFRTWCMKNFCTIFTGVVLATIYFVFSYVKKPDREVASMQDEYDFCEKHAVCSTLDSMFQC